MASQHRFAALLTLLVVGVLASAWYSRRYHAIDCPVPAAEGAAYQMVRSLEASKQITGSYPTTEQGLSALISKPTKLPVPERWQKLLESDAVDPWGSPFIYRCPGLKHPERYDLICLGPDRMRSKDDAEVP